jgi:hypothetical protein
VRLVETGLINHNIVVQVGPKVSKAQKSLGFQFFEYVVSVSGCSGREFGFLRSLLALQYWVVMRQNKIWDQ